MNAEQYQALLKTMTDLQTSVDAGFASLSRGAAEKLKKALGKGT